MFSSPTLPVLQVLFLFNLFMYLRVFWLFFQANLTIVHQSSSSSKFCQNFSETFNKYKSCSYLDYKDRLQAAEQKVKGEVTRPSTGKRAVAARKGGKPKKGKDIQASGPDKEELAKQREALREAKKLEKMVCIFNCIPRMNVHTGDTMA